MGLSSEGAHSYAAQTTFPPVTLPAHMSLFHSVKTERYGVWTNTFVPMNLDIPETKACKDHIAEYAPDFVRLSLGMVDEYGHGFGWMSPEYLECVRTSTECIMDVVNFLPPEYSVIVTADYGGHDRNHGDNVPEDMTIPLTCHGPMFEKGRVIEDACIIDIAPTITEILGIDPDEAGNSRLSGVVHRFCGRDHHPGVL